MPQIAINSANITTFRFGVEFDIYNRKVVFSDISTFGGSSGSGIFSVLGISFSLIDQGGVELTTINFSDTTKYIVPGVTRTFELDLSSLSFPFLFQTYEIKGAIKDSNGTIYYTTPVYKKICQPVNLNDGGYVPGIFQVTPNCVDNVLSIKELTPLIYNNQTPALTTKSGTLSYPTGTISAVSFTGTPWANNVIYTGQYRIVCTTESEYDLEDDVTVLVTYLTNNVFDVTCANKIADLICCMVGLQTTYLKNCNSATGKAAKQQLDEITIPFLLGLTKEINGQDASTEADLIKKTLKCDCGATSIHQNEFSPINPSATNIVLTGVGGTTIPSPTINGNTKTYNIASSVYQVVKGNTGDLSFSIEIDNSTQYLVKYKITLNYETLAATILTTIGANTTLRNQLNSLINSSGGVSLAGLDGSCIIDTSSCDYVLTQSFAVDGVVVKNIIIDGTTYTAPGGLVISTPGPIQTWLNGLGKGTWGVSYNANLVPPGGVILIQTSSNTHTIGTVTFTSGASDTSYVFVSTCKTLVQVLQAIIDYLCELTALQVLLGDTITLWQIDYNGALTSYSYTNDQSQGALNQAIADSIYNIVLHINTLTAVTCAKIAAVFPDSPSATFGDSGRLYGTTGSDCVAFSDKQIAELVIAAIGKYSDVKTAFCAIDCSEPATCPEVSNINLAMSGSNIGVYGLTWATLPVATQTVTVRHKLSSSSVWITDTSALQILANGNISGVTPFVITGITAGETYDVQIVNNCGGVGFIKQITTPTGTVYSGSYLLDNMLYLICGNSTVTLYSTEPFAPGVIMYTNPSLTILATGYSYIADNSGTIYTINSLTAVVGSSTGSVCDTGTSNIYILGNSTGTICAGTPITLYTNGAFNIGGTIYLDSGLTTPVTGYSYVVNSSNNHIYNLNSITGVIGSDTGLTCGIYSGNYILTNILGNACSDPTITLYHSAPFSPGVTMYIDSGLTTLADGYVYINDLDGGSIVYNMNSVSAVVGSSSGSSC